MTGSESLIQSRKPRLLDLFCGAGGAAKGYREAGFWVMGIDHVFQHRYAGNEFHPADALTALAAYIEHGDVFGATFDAVHASPPCQHYANVTRWRGDQADHPDHVGVTRELLEATGLPWVMENVREAGLRDPLLLCGSMFGLRVQRHRHFEANWPLGQMSPFGCAHVGLLPFMHKGERAYADAMGCDWMSNLEARQAVPPAYTRWIGDLLMSHVTETAAA